MERFDTKCRGTWHDTKCLKFGRRVKTHFWGRKIIFLLSGRERERERKKKIPNFSLRSTKFRWSEFVEPRTKVHLPYEVRVGTENMGFHRGFKRGVQEIEFFGIRRCSRDFLQFFYALRGRNSSYFGLFSTLRAVGCVLCPKGMFGPFFFSLRGCLEKFWG